MHASISAQELFDQQRERLTARQSKPPDLVVVQALRAFTCAGCGQTDAELVAPRLDERPRRLDGAIEDGAEVDALLDDVLSETAPGNVVLNGQATFKALVYDATGISTTADLAELHRFFSPTIRAIARTMERDHDIVRGARAIEADEHHRRLHRQR